MKKRVNCYEQTEHINTLEEGFELEVTQWYSGNFFYY